MWIQTNESIYTTAEHLERIVATQLCY